ncbi:MAG: sulfatase [Gemmataceae bacterium]|nr:sulfatase [Gemmataceae bacterium]
MNIVIRRQFFVLSVGILLILSAPAAGADRPNIIFMLSDDQAWHGLSVAMHPDVADSKSDVYQTPNLARFAAEGMRFSAAYASAPVCSPSRISIQTGKSPAQLHWTKAAPPETGRKLNEPTLIKNLATSETTVGELLRQAGYATAHYGKWHLRGGGPGAHGYDEHDGDTGNEEAAKFTDPNPVDIFGMANRAAAFMEKNKKAGKPFYIQLSWHALHVPGNANKATLAKYEKIGNVRRSQVAAITEDLDTGVGRVLKSVADLGLADNTYVIYMSDNGGGGGRSPLTGGKGDVYEGGIRVPFIVRGPGIKANSWCHTRIVGFDLLPTFCDWAGIPAKDLPRKIEGGSIAGLLSHEGKGKVSRPREELVFHFPHYQGDTPHSAIIVGDMKLIKFYEDNHVALYDLAKDLRERNDLSKKMPEDAARLENRLLEYLKAVDAQMPTPNSKYDPKAPAPQGKKKQKQ